MDEKKEHNPIAEKGQEILVNVDKRIEAFFSCRT